MQLLVARHWQPMKLGLDPSSRLSLSMRGHSDRTGRAPGAITNVIRSSLDCRANSSGISGPSSNQYRRIGKFRGSQIREPQPRHAILVMPLSLVDDRRASQSCFHWTENQTEVQRLHDLEHGCESRVAIRRKRLVEALPAKPCLRCDLRHAVGPGHIAQRSCNQLRVAILKSRIEVGGNVLFILQMIRRVPGAGLDWFSVHSRTTGGCAQQSVPSDGEREAIRTIIQRLRSG